MNVVAIRSKIVNFPFFQEFENFLKCRVLIFTCTINFSTHKSAIWVKRAHSESMLDGARAGGGNN